MGQAVVRRGCPASRVLRDSRNTQSRLVWWSQAAYPAHQGHPGRPSDAKGTSGRPTSEPRTLPSARSWATTGNPLVLSTEPKQDNFLAATSTQQDLPGGDLSVARTLGAGAGGAPASWSTEPRFDTFGSDLGPTLQTGASQGCTGFGAKADRWPARGGAHTGRLEEGCSGVLTALRARPQPLGHSPYALSAILHLGAEQGEGALSLTSQQPWRRTYFGLT